RVLFRSKKSEILIHQCFGFCLAFPSVFLVEQFFNPVNGCFHRRIIRVSVDHLERPQSHHTHCHYTATLHHPLACRSHHMPCIQAVSPSQSLHSFFYLCYAIV